jgi:hypothetical protein
MSRPDRNGEDVSSGAVRPDDQLDANSQKVSLVMGWVESDWFLKWLELAKQGS